jgi:hypothetical protein
VLAIERFYCIWEEKKCFFSQKSIISKGYSRRQADETTEILYPHHLRYWLDLCGGQHELNQYDYRKDELHGKLGWMRG